MSEYQANMELVQDQQVADRRHLHKVVQSDNAASAYLAAYKARKGQPAKEYGSAMWWSLAAGVAILAAVVLNVTGAL